MQLHRSVPAAVQCLSVPPCLRSKRSLHKLPLPKRSGQAASHAARPAAPMAFKPPDYWARLLGKKPPHPAAPPLPRLPRPPARPPAPPPAPHRLSPAVHIPVRGGHWQGAPGRSGWLSDNPAVQKVTGGTPVSFNDYYPDFAPWAQAIYTFAEGQLRGRPHDMILADQRLAADRGLGDKKVARRYRQEHALVWHHREDAVSLILLPIGLHGNIPHAGGASLLRQKYPES